MAELEKLRSAPFYLSWILIAQSLSIIGFLSTHNFPHAIRIVGNNLTTSVFQGSEITEIIASTVILLTARAIRLRRRRAWILATTLQSFLILTSVIHGLIEFTIRHKEGEIVFHPLGVSRLILELLILLLLIYFRKDFKTKSDIQTVMKSIFFYKDHDSLDPSWTRIR